MKRRLTAFCVSLLAAGMVFAQGTKEEAAPAEAQQPAGKVQIQFWHSMGGAAGDVLNEVCKAFNESQDKIEVVPSFQGDYWTAASKAIAAVSAGENPDLLMMGADHVAVFSKEDGILVDLLPYMQRDGIDPDDFIEGFSWDYRLDGGMIAIPFGRSVPVLYLNQDMFDQEGLKAPVTWTDWEDVSLKLVQKDDKGEVTRYGFAMERSPWYYYMTVAQAGGDLINKERTGMGCIENGNALRAWSFLQKLKRENAMFFGPVNNSGNTCVEMFLEGKAGMLLGSVGALSMLEERAPFKVTLIGCPYDRVNTFPTGGNAIVMLEGSSHKEETWQFMRWLIQDPKGILYFSQNTGYMPVTKSMAASPEEQALWKKMPNRATAYSLLQYASDKGSRVPQGGAIMNELFTFIDATMYDDEDVQEQLDILAANIAKIMQEQ